MEVTVQGNTFSLVPQSAGLEDLVAQANAYAEAAKAPATRKAYAADLRDFTDFCARVGQPAFAPGGQALALYITDQARRGRKPSTIDRKVAAIATEFHANGFRETPASTFVVKEVLRGVKRTHGTAPDRKDPLLVEDLERIVAACPGRLIGLRDTALTLFGFAIGGRRATIAAVQVRDLELTSQGLLVTIRRGKEDQEQQGRQVPVAFGRRPETCPIRALGAWLRAAGIVDGPLFRAVDRHGNVSARPLEPGSIARILKKAARRSGMGEEEVAKIGGHSLRAGMATTAAIHGAEEREIAQVTGHRSREVRRYIRDANLFRASAAGRLGL
jgi:integrase